jgi:hypothetical protein
VLGIVAIATGLWRPVWRSSLRATDYDGSLIAGLPTANAPRSALRETRSRPRAASSTPSLGALDPAQIPIRWHRIAR